MTDERRAEIIEALKDLGEYCSDNEWCNGCEFNAVCPANESPYPCDWFHGEGGRTWE